MSHSADQGRGIVHLVGSGPGDPGLITVRGAECLRRADVVLYDDLSSQALLDQLDEAVERVYVGKRGSHKTLPQPDVDRLLVQHAARGRRVVRLKGGDPYVFGHGGEEAEALAEAGVAFEVVPGISSAVAVPAHAGIPLTHPEHADGFQVETGHAGDAGGAGPGGGPRRTAVVLMGMRRLVDNVARLRRQGYPGNTPAAVIQWGTLPRQRTVAATLDTIVEQASDLGSPAVLVAGDVVTLRSRLAWFEARPLFGKRVLVTRAPHQARQTCHAFEELGATVVPLPTIQIRPPADPAPLRRAVQRLARRSYQHLLLTSHNAVEQLWRELGSQELDARALAGSVVSAIGPGTAAALAQRGVTPDLVPEDHRAEGLLELLPAERVDGCRVLLPRAAVARELLPETLARRGATVDVVTAYETGLPDPERTGAGVEELERGAIDVLTFTSASTAENLASIVGPDRLRDLARGAVVAAIGPVTRAACERLGLTVDVSPVRYTIEAMARAVVEHLQPHHD